MGIGSNTTKNSSTVNQLDTDFNNVDTGLVEGADLSTNLNFNLNNANLGGLNYDGGYKSGGRLNLGSSVTQGVGLGGDVGGGGGSGVAGLGAPLF